jgi:hypothetical protein
VDIPDWQEIVRLGRPEPVTRTRVMPCCPIVSISTWRKCASDELGLPQSRPVNLPPQMIFPFISSVVSHASDTHILFVDLCEALTSDTRFDSRGSPPPLPVEHYGCWDIKTREYASATVHSYL